MNFLVNPILTRRGQTVHIINPTLDFQTFLRPWICTCSCISLGSAANDFENLHSRTYYIHTYEYDFFKKSHPALLGFLCKKKKCIVASFIAKMNIHHSSSIFLLILHKDSSSDLPFPPNCSEVQGWNGQVNIFCPFSFHF